MIEVKNLTKLYGKFKAVDDVSLCAADGEVTILLGPNGAGKSTTIKSITNLLQYKGDIKINGVANSSLDAKKGFGYIPEAPVLYDLLTIDEHVEFIGKAYRCENYRALADEYIALFKLEDKRKKAVRELSKGRTFCFIPLDSARTGFLRLAAGLNRVIYSSASAR